MIEFKNCTFHYEGKALIKDFNALIRNGEKVVLYGPSGSGKSTLLHAILRFLTPAQGTIFVQGSTAWLPQDLSLPYQTVEEMIMSPFCFKANIRQRPSRIEIQDTFSNLLLEPDLLNKNINEISGGQKQRILLATAILLKKQILLLDEPTSALDPASVSAVTNTLMHLTDTTIVAVSHDLSFIDTFERKILIPKL